MIFLVVCPERVPHKHGIGPWNVFTSMKWWKTTQNSVWCRNTAAEQGMQTKLMNLRLRVMLENVFSCWTCFKNTTWGIIKCLNAFGEKTKLLSRFSVFHKGMFGRHLGLLLTSFHPDSVTYLCYQQQGRGFFWTVRWRENIVNKTQVMIRLSAVLKNKI